MRQIREKVIVVLDVVRDVSWSRLDVLENAPDWIGIALRRAAGGEGSQYGFEDPTVYVSIEDFDADRARGVDHFARKQAKRWKPTLNEGALWRLTPLTDAIRAAFLKARQTAKRGQYDQWFTACPVCNGDVYVAELTDADGHRWHGRWDLSGDGFVWGNAANGSGDSQDEVVQCEGCKLRRPLTEFDFNHED